MRTLLASLSAVVPACLARVLSGVLLAVSVGVSASADLVVTHIAPYSGPAGSIGRDYGNGARLYFDHVNAHGGINGSRILLISRDDANDPELTRKQADAALKDKPIAFIGTVGTSNVINLIPTLTALQAPLLDPVVNAAGVSATDSAYIFPFRPAVREEIEGLTAELYHLGLKKIAVCNQSGAAGAAGAESFMAARDTKLLITARCDGDALEIEAAASTIAAMNPQAVIFVGDTSRAGLFIKALRANGSFAMVATSSSVDPKALVTMIPPSAAIWLAVAENVPNPNLAMPRRGEAIVREFLAMSAVSPSPMPMSRTSLAGFITAKITTEAIRRAGANPTSADVLKVLAQLRNYDAGGMMVNFAQDRPRGTNYTRLGIISANGVVLN